MKTRILSLFLAVLMILSTMTMLGISVTAEATPSTVEENNVLHISNSNTEDAFWCNVSTSLTSTISDGYVEFDINTKRVGTRSFMNFMLLNSAETMYSNIAIQRDSGKYYFNKQAGSTHIEELSLTNGTT